MIDPRSQCDQPFGPRCVGRKVISVDQQHAGGGSALKRIQVGACDSLSRFVGEQEPRALLCADRQLEPPRWRRVAERELQDSSFAQPRLPGNDGSDGHEACNIVSFARDHRSQGRSKPKAEEAHALHTRGSA